MKLHFSTTNPEHLAFFFFFFFISRSFSGFFSLPTRHLSPPSPARPFPPRPLPPAADAHARPSPSRPRSSPPPLNPRLFSHIRVPALAPPAPPRRCPLRGLPIKFCCRAGGRGPAGASSLTDTGEVASLRCRVGRGGLWWWWVGGDRGGGGSGDASALRSRGSGCRCVWGDGPFWKLKRGWGLPQRRGPPRWQALGGGGGGRDRGGVGGVWRKE